MTLTSVLAIENNLDIDLKFLYCVGDGWVTIKMMLQGNENLKDESHPTL